MLVEGKEINGIVAVKKFFEFAEMQKFKTHWDALSDKDKTDLTTGLHGTNPTFTY